MKKTITCQKTNPLHKQISEVEKYQIEELKVVGFLSDVDYAFLTEMCQEAGRLRILDLHDVNETETETSFENEWCIEYKMKEGDVVIPENVFQNCVRLEEIVFPAHLAAIGAYSFMYCENLKEVNFPETLENIYYKTFYHCSKLKEVYLPNNPFANGCDPAFAGGVQKFRLKIDQWPFNEKGEYVSIIEGSFTYKGVLFIDNGYLQLYKYPSYNTDEYYEVPLGTEDIYSGAFWECKYLKTLIINADTIFESAIIDCPNLERIVIKSGSISECRYTSFSYCAGSPIIKCPKLRDIYFFSRSPKEVDYIFQYLEGKENIVLHVPRYCADFYRDYDVPFTTIPSSGFDVECKIICKKAWQCFKRIEEFNPNELLRDIYEGNI